MNSRRKDEEEWKMIFATKIKKKANFHGLIIKLVPDIW